MKKKILWEKWIDPFLSNLDEVELSAGAEDEDGGYKDSYQQMEDIVKKGGPKKNYTGPVMVGPMGVIPLNEYNTPSKVYCFWMGHTNFDITRAVAKLIEEVPGVEALDIFTRYRFRVAFGKAFIDKDTGQASSVMRDIEKAICCNQQEENKVVEKVKKSSTEVNLNLLKSHLKKNYPYWVIYTLPDGTYGTYGSQTKEEAIKETETHPEHKVVASSWE